MCIDGSDASAARGTLADLSNVYRLIQALHFESAEGPQLAYYFSGVGTRGDSLSAVSGRGLDEIIREVYANIAANFIPGDQIYLFGWSRGGAAARAVASLITSVGLLHADQLGYLHEVIQLHGLKDREKRHATGLTPLETRELQRITTNLENDRLHNDCRVRFVGLFDPVAGNKWDKLHRFTRTTFHDDPLESATDVGVSLLSIDDRRVPSFAPVLWREATPNQHLEQIWMPGVHADVGGGSGAGRLSDLALLTMIDRLAEHCPEVVLDEGYFIAGLLKRYRDYPRTSITSEFGGFRKLLRRGRRRIGAVDATSETLHPETSRLSGKMISMRNRPAKYPDIASEADVRLAALGRIVGPFYS